METPASKKSTPAPAASPAEPGPPPRLSQWAITLIVIVIVAMVMVPGLAYFGPLIPGKWVIGAYALLVLFYVGRRLHHAFFKAQSRLSELLATTFVAGVMMAAVSPLVPPGRSSVMIVLAAVCITFAFFGAAWGWHAARRLDENNPRKRFWLLMQGWLFIFCTLGAFASATLLPSLANGPMELFLALVAFVLCLALCVPTLLTEMKCRKRDKTLAAKPAPILPSDKSRAPNPIVNIIFSPLQWVLGPLIVKANTWITPKGDAAQKQLSELPENVAKVFSEASDELSSEGFAPAAYLDYGKRTDNTSLWAMLSCNRASGDMAVFSFLDTRAQKFVMVQTIAAFFTRCGEQDRTVSNRSDGSLFSGQPNSRAVFFPAATDLRALYRVHRAWTQQEFGAAERILPPPGGEVAHYADLDRRALENLDKTGILFLDKKSGKYRTTWRGACVLTWKSAWPWKQIINARQRRNAAELCQKLDVPYPN